MNVFGFNGGFLDGIIRKNSFDSSKCNLTSNITKFYYYIEDLKIDLSGDIPYIKSFDIFALSNAGLESGWTQMSSYLIPIHFVQLDVEKSSDFKFVVKKETEAVTNLEHPGFKYKQKIGMFLNMEYSIEKIKFAYDSSNKIVYNLNKGIIGQTRVSSGDNIDSERAYLRISIKSQKSTNYYHFVNKQNQNQYIKNRSKNKSINDPEVVLGDRKLRIDYPDDPNLTNEQFKQLSLNDKFIYQFLHGRTSSLTQNKNYNRIEKLWNNYSQNNNLDLSLIHI